MSLKDVIQTINEQAALQEAESRRDRRIMYATDVYGFAASYDNAVIIAGYVAFFALWSGTADDVNRFARLITVVLMGTSLMLYIAFQMLQMIARQKHEHEMADCFEFEDQPAKFNAMWEDIELRRNKSQMMVLAWWPWIFIPSVSFGFAAAILLTVNALCAAFGWPQLTGRI